jgi:hypothetical protein
MLFIYHIVFVYFPQTKTNGTKLNFFRLKWPFLPRSLHAAPASPGAPARALTAIPRSLPRESRATLNEINIFREETMINSTGSVRALFFGILTALLAVSYSAQARSFDSGGPQSENSYMVANGQGVSSPSFWTGMEGQNPAGLAYNQTTKLQGGLAFDDNGDSARGSGGILTGNGEYGAGIEYSKYNAGEFYDNDAVLNFGAAARISSLSTTVGLSGHDYLNNGTGSSNSSYDLGVLINPMQNVRIGAMLPDFTNGLHVIAAGLTYMVDPAADLVIDGAYQNDGNELMVKPGLTLRANNMLQATAAYGFHINGADDVFLYHGFSGGVGIRLTDSVLIEYEYRVLPEHRVGLTLRFN